MNRSDSVTYLSEQFGTIAAELGVTATDTTAGYKAPIDTALRLVGITETDLATAEVTANIVTYQTALDFTTLQYLWRKASVRVDITVGTPAVSKKRSQVFAQIGDMLKAARSAAEDAGVLDGAASWQAGRIGLDYLEPSLADQS